MLREGEPHDSESEVCGRTLPALPYLALSCSMSPNPRSDGTVSECGMAAITGTAYALQSHLTYLHGWWAIRPSLWYLFYYTCSRLQAFPCPNEHCSRICSSHSSMSGHRS